MTLKSSIFGRYLQVIYDLNLNKSEKTHMIIVQAIYDLFILVRGDIDAAKLEMCIDTASGAWLDYWGSFFGISRLENEPDDKYSIRMISEIIEPKGTVKSLQIASSRWLNNQNSDNWEYNDITVVEPWKELMRLSHRGTLSHTARLWDNYYYCYGRIDIILPDSTEITPEIINYLRKIKAAGVQILWTITANNWEIITDFFNVNTYYYMRTLEIDAPVEYVPHGFRTNYADNFPNPYQREEIPNLGLYEVNTSGDYSVDSLYNESFLNVEGLLSGNPVIWAEVVGICRDLLQARQRIHSYYYSGTIQMKDIATIGDSEYEVMSLGAVFDLEDTSDILSYESLNAPYITNPLNVSQSSIVTLNEPAISDREVKGIAFTRPISKWFINTLDEDFMEQFIALQEQDHIYSDLNITEFFSYPQLIHICNSESTSVPPYKYLEPVDSDNCEDTTIQRTEELEKSLDNKLLWIVNTSDNLMLPFDILTESVAEV